MNDYFEEMFPTLNWSMQEMRPCLYTFFKRIDRMCSRLVKSSSLRRKIDWRAICSIVKERVLTLFEKNSSANITSGYFQVITVNRLFRELCSTKT